MFGLSFLIPSYNPKAEEIQNLVLSILKSAANIDYEIIIFDDSNDESALNELSVRFANYIQSENLIIKKTSRISLLEKRFLLIKESKFDYFTFMDADDSIKFVSFHDLLSKMEKENIDLLEFPFFVKSDSSSTLTLSPRQQEPSLQSYEKTLLTTDTANSLCNKIYCKTVFSTWESLQNALPAIHLGEDKLLNILLLKNLKSYLFIDKPYYIYCQHSSSITHSMDISKRSSDTIEIYNFYKQQNITSTVFKNASALGYAMQRDFSFLILSASPKRRLFKKETLSLLKSTENALNQICPNFWKSSKMNYLSLAQRLFLPSYRALYRMFGGPVK